MYRNVFEARIITFEPTLIGGGKERGRGREKRKGKRTGKEGETRIKCMQEGKEKGKRKERPEFSV